MKNIRIEQTDKDLPKHWLSGSMKYDDFEPLTEGGSASIRLAFDKNLQRTVAYKALHPHLRDSELDNKRFLREARVTALIPHPGTVPVYELGRDRNGELYFTMKKIEGRDLRAVIMDMAAGDLDVARQFPLSRLIDILISACQTVAYAHAHGVIHRDLKPANITVGEFGEVMVLDWGLAKVRGEVQPDIDMQVTGETGLSLALTQPGRRAGTPLYMSPEQARGDVTLDERTDVFNLGSILYEMLTWKGLITAETIEQAMEQITERPTPLPSEAAPEREIPLELEAVCLKCLEKDPAARYQTVMELADDLQRYRDREEVTAYDYQHHRLKRAMLWAEHHRVHLVGAGCAIGGLVIGLVIGSAT
ncbi:MAG: protein kinase [Phycisphaera sp.]|nr:protein kinase [Phycisphaera sp.]